MRLGHTRLAFVSGVLLLSVACSSNQTAAPAEDQAAAAPTPTETPMGTEEAVAPSSPSPAVQPEPTPTPARVPQAAVRSQSRSGPAPATAARSTNRTSAPAAPVSAAPEPPARDDERARNDERARDERPARATVDREEVPSAPRTQLISIPANTPLRLALTSAVGSDTSAVEDRITARVARTVVVDGADVIPEGSRVNGRVTYAQPSGKVKGRAGVTVRFYSLTVGSRTYDINTEPVRQQADSNKGKDAQKIGMGAGAGAVIGGLLGGRKGAVIGAAAGGAGGTGMVLATRGEEVRLPAGTTVTTALAEPLVVEHGPGTDLDR